jgi:hypothetical protein
MRESRELTPEEQAYVALEPMDDSDEQVRSGWQDVLDELDDQLGTAVTEFEFDDEWTRAG